MGKVTGILTGMAMPLIIFAILCLKFYGSIKKHMHLWGAIGRELDDKMVVPLTSYPHKNAHNNDYDSVGAPAREGGGNHRWDNSKDSLRLEGQVSLPSGESPPPTPTSRACSRSAASRAGAPTPLLQGGRGEGVGVPHHRLLQGGPQLLHPRLRALDRH